jgi:hypothetical protein
MKCIWCDCETTTNKANVSDQVKLANKEHIIPECVGGKQCLEIGKVCVDCNNKLNPLDECLKRGNYMMLAQYQISSAFTGGPIGKKAGKGRKERKEREMKEISGFGGLHITRHSAEHAILNAPVGTPGDYFYDEKFSKALHKCALNIILNDHDYFYVKNNCSELISFILNPVTPLTEGWSYAVCYRNLFSQSHFDPFWLNFGSDTAGSFAFLMVFPGAMFIVGTQQDNINPDTIKKIEKEIPENLGIKGDEFNAVQHFSSIPPHQRSQFGERFKFVFIKKSIQGTPNSIDDFYLLTHCRTCGQINPTGIMFGKDFILTGNQSQTISGPKNTWNVYTREDFFKTGFNFNAWSEDSIRAFIENRAINYPAENDVKKLNITNCSTQCINCGWLIQYGAPDCFL